MTWPALEQLIDASNLSRRNRTVLKAFSVHVNRPSTARPYPTNMLTWPGMETLIALTHYSRDTIQAAKRAPELIPLCHPLLVGSVLVNFRIEDDFVEVEAQVDTVDRTGVEMEAMTACSVACLTIYDMCKSVDRGMTIGEIALWEKTGGRSGGYRRTEAPVSTSTSASSDSADPLDPADRDFGL